MRCHRRQNGGCVPMQKVPLEGGLCGQDVANIVADCKLTSVSPRYVPSLRFNVGQRSRILLKIMLFYLVCQARKYRAT